MFPSTSSSVQPEISVNIESNLKYYLDCLDELPIHDFKRHQQFWPKKPTNPLDLLNYDVAPLSRTLKFKRNKDTCKTESFEEYQIDSSSLDPKNSTSFKRAPAAPDESVQGSTLFVPFQPGSFPLEIKEQRCQSTAEANNIFDKTKFLRIPPGFSEGLTFADDGFTLIDGGDCGIDKENLKNDGMETKDEADFVDLLELINSEQNSFDYLTSSATAPSRVEDKTENLDENRNPFILNDIPVINITTTVNSNRIPFQTKREWAILLDTNKPVENFQEKIPNMAKTFKFELDNFQKMAISLVEDRQHVFVAAHTSAGKTVVAEYAIALSQKNLTKTIYTSPIKALSNQKYRDFKEEFNDVGLITGDFQINQKASCLVMTTEILRSMLYCGSDITRDLEFVIFDEVHYINNRERGHVWEQVLIMLPADVCVILLSATVPNTLEFADWLGRTHKRKVYVITTLYRPVPLQHFLYTGRWGGSKDNRFLVLDEEKWVAEGYFKATDVLEPVQNLNLKFLNKQQEKTLWTSLISHLKKFELFPVVAFVFSRQKCDTNAEILGNIDLTTQKEKSQIMMFFNKCIRYLKEIDRNIPQIIKIRDILIKGIAVHHSGMLPIIKEIVEMLFQKGLIKILFATETFAMGVNMPTRTVIFDSINKHDGVQLRDLLPAEYIQMAGRAGRRGKDEKGTVIILCKVNVPPDYELKKIMTGLPEKLMSQFKITYSMVLTLLRVETLSVESILSRSFGEVDHQSREKDVKAELTATENQLKLIYNEECTPKNFAYLQPLTEFYEYANSYLNWRSNVMSEIIKTSKLQKVLIPGTIIKIIHKQHLNKLALILALDQTKRPTIYKVLVLTESTATRTTKDDISNKKDNKHITNNDLWYYMLGLSMLDTLFVPVRNPGHEVLNITYLDIFKVSSKILKLKFDVVLQDWQKRQIERFRNDPPGPTCLQAVQELQKLSVLTNEQMQNNKIIYLHLIKDLKLNTQDLYISITKMYDLEEKLWECLSDNRTKISNFEEKFVAVFEKKFLETKKRELEFKLSNHSLSLYPDYENRIQLLRQLNYIDLENKVQLKGRIACEMGMDELLITELVVDDIFSILNVAEIAGLLSALVFRNKMRKNQEKSNTNELSQNLLKCIEHFKEIYQKIANLELTLQIQNDDNELNFGLAHVVYKWASGEAFADIMKLTEIQEGIVVRGIQQLHETVMNIRNAARIIGNPELRKKMDDISKAIKRDIIFAESLYTQDEKF